MEPSQEQVAELKQIETDILRRFVEICGRLNLRYYLLGGTLLGAVRHQGFIPWDDDIDVGMLREDYEIFLEHGQVLLPDNLFIQTIWTDSGYLNCFAKIRNSNTAFIETAAAKRKMNHGVFIDIFPLDHYPQNIQQQKKIDAQKRIYTQRINSLYVSKHSLSIRGMLINALLKVRYPSYRSVLRKRDAMYKAEASGVLIANHGGAWGKKEIVPADWYGEGVEVNFEGMKVMAPTQYDKWLTQVYGDYMQLPPVEKRVGHHYVDVIDLHKSYKEYMER